MTDTPTKTLKPPSMGFRLVEYSKRDLTALLADDQFWAQSKLPITRRRALSHIANACAAENDILLIAAFHNGELVAYSGVMPDLLKREQTVEKFGWLMTWWVDKSSSCRMAATMILFAAMKRYSNRVAAAIFSADAKRIYDATKRFRQCAQFDTSYFVMSLPPSYRLLSDVLSWFGGVKNRLMFASRPKARGIEIDTVTKFDGDLISFLDKVAGRDPLIRNAAYFKWALEYPWVTSTAEDEANQERYAFSLFAREFRQIPLVIRRNGDIIAFVFLTLREKRLSLKYAYYRMTDLADVGAALRAAISKINPWIFVSADHDINLTLQKGLPFYLARRRKAWLAYATEDIASRVGTRPQFGIGDSIFT